MAQIIIMPKLGFNMNEGTLVAWYKQEGDRISKGEPLFSIETDKTNMDIEATEDAVVRKLLIEEGEKVPVTLPIAILGTEEEKIDDILSEALRKLGRDQDFATAVPTEYTGGEVSEKDRGGGMSSQDSCNTTAVGIRQQLRITPRARRTAKENGLDLSHLRGVIGTGFQGGICEQDVLKYLSENAAGCDADTSPEASLPHVKASPLAKAIAIEKGVDLAKVTGSGAFGKVMKQDVNSAATAACGESEICSGAGNGGLLEPAADGKEILEKIPYAGIRKIIGDRLSQSMFTAPHLFFTQKVNLEELLQLRSKVNGAQGQKVSVTDFIARAGVMALQKYPQMNSSLVDNQIVKYRTVNMGIAVAAETGLIVPVVKNAEKMRLVEIAKNSAALVEKARSGKLTPDEYSGGTFTISNLGMFGIENFTAIINPPEMGILAVSATKDEPWVVTGADGKKEIAVKPVMNIQLSTDHRVIDGLLAAQFVTEIKTLLEDPVSLLL